MKKIHVANRIDIRSPRLYISDAYLIALGQQGNYLYDTSEKTNPLLLNEFSLSKDKYGSANIFLGLINKKAYFSIGYGGIEAVDFQNEKNPASLGLMSDYLIGGRWEFYAGEYLITNPRVLVIYDLTSAEPKPIYKFREETNDFLIVQNYLICIQLKKDIKVFDISQPSTPQLIFSLKLSAIRLIAKNHQTILAEGEDNAIYILDVSNVANIKIAGKIDIPGPIFSNSIVRSGDIIFVRFMIHTAGDTINAYDIRNIKKPQKIFSYKTVGIIFYIANEKFLVLIGIKDWDGVSPISQDTSNYYQVFQIQRDSISHHGDIELKRFFFSSVILSENVIYIARIDGIHIYEIR